MKKDTLTFYHDYYARHDEKILCLRATYNVAGYGTFWILIEMLWESEQSKLRHKFISGIAHQNNIDITLLNDVITECISLELLHTDGEYFWSEAVLRRKEERDAVRAKYSAAGKKGMENRYKSLQSEEKPNDVITTPNDVITESNKKRESKEKEKEKEKGKVNKSEIEEGEADKPHTPPEIDKKFIPPTIEMCIDYFAEKMAVGWNIDFAESQAEKFWFFYESKGWMVGKNKMKSWHSAVSTWIKGTTKADEQKFLNKGENNGRPTTTANGYGRTATASPSYGTKEEHAEIARRWAERLDAATHKNH